MVLTMIIFLEEIFWSNDDKDNVYNADDDEILRRDFLMPMMIKMRIMMMMPIIFLEEILWSDDATHKEASLLT